MQPEEWAKKHEEENRINRSWKIYSQQVNDKLEELENRNDDLLNNIGPDTSDVHHGDYLRRHVAFNLRYIMRLEKRIKELEERLKEHSLW